jgi:hypothetical protein
MRIRNSTDRSVTDLKEALDGLTEKRLHETVDELRKWMDR